MSKSFVTLSRYWFGKEVLGKMQVEGSDAESFILCDRVLAKSGLLLDSVLSEADE